VVAWCGESGVVVGVRWAKSRWQSAAFLVQSGNASKKRSAA
jgi:hypothetical protein